MVSSILSIIISGSASIRIRMSISRNICINMSLQISSGSINIHIITRIGINIRNRASIRNSQYK